MKTVAMSRSRRKRAMPILMPDGHVVAKFVCCVVLCCVVLCCGLVAGGWREVHFITLKKARPRTYSAHQWRSVTTAPLSRKTSRAIA